MVSRHISLWAGLLLTLPAAAAFGQQNFLPDLPEPGYFVNRTPAVVENRGWSDIVSPGEEAPPLDVKDKLLLPVRQELRPPSWFGTFLSSGWEQLRDSAPRYGVDAGAYGQRLGAAAVRDISMRAFSNGFLPVLLHEDPRYYRMAEGPKAHRGLYAASRVLVGRRDSGALCFNTSVVAGHGMASALTMAYYPEKSANAHAVFTTWGLSLLGQAGGNLWSEFWPDTREKLFHHRRKEE